MNSESIHNQDKQNHSKSTQELIELAIGIKKVQEINDYVGQVFCLSMASETPILQKMLLDFFLWKSLKDEDAYWDIVGVLRCRGSYEVFEAASKLCESKNSKFRELGVQILAQLGTPKKDFSDESGVILLKLLENEENIDVVIAIAFALGHLKDSRGVVPLVKFKDHFRADVRESIVFGLLGQEDELAINALIELSADENQDVRNWATFGLGGDMIETDTQEIRDALFQRVVDEKGDTDLEAEIRGEALLGLAKRKDKRVINFLIKELSGDSVGTLPVEAAREIGDSSLYPVLIELKEWWGMNSELLQEAIKNCSQEQT
jgi:HEAT repeat protein